MPAFDETATAQAPPEEVWKLIYDPARFPEWWDGVGTVDPGSEPGAYTMYPAGYPDFPMPQLLRTRRVAGRAEISCLVSDLVFAWHLRPRTEGTSTEIGVHVEIPTAEAHRLDSQREVIRRSLINLVRLAEQGS